jgi:uncharacterized membrane protein HdeD (DUF308 family)
MTQERAAQIARAWWLIALVGVASLIAGGIIVAKPSDSLATLAVVFGVFILIDSLIELFSSFGHEVQNRGLAAVIGVLGIIVGLVLIRHPTKAISVLGLIIGIWLVAAGALRLIGAIALGRRVLLRVAIAVLEIAVGIAIIANPHIGYATLAVLLGIWLILNGIGMIAAAFAIRAAKSALTAQAEPTG